MIISPLVEQFVLYLKEIILNDKSISNNNLRDIKWYLESHKDDLEVIEAKRTLAEQLYSLYTNTNLTIALSNPDYFKYQKILDIHEKDPARLYPNLLSFFNATIYIPSGSYIEDNVSWFLNDMGFPYVKNLDKLRDFSKTHKSPSKDNTYGTLEQDIDRYLKLKNNIMPDDYEEFCNDKVYSAVAFNHYYEGNPKMDYLKKKLGNIGEMHLLNELETTKHNVRLVSRDIGNGLGYDIYSQTVCERGIMETLIEVKSTTDMSRNYFSLTKTERDTMTDSLNDYLTEYIVCLSHIDVEKNIYVNEYFRAITEDIFINIDTFEEYKLDGIDSYGNYIFKHNEKVLRKQVSN